MKTKFLFAALAAAAMTACSTDEVVDVNKGNAISFRTSVDRAVTRTTITTSSNMGSFNVTAIGNSAVYFTDLTVTSSDGGTNWTTASKYYWPGYDLNFYAYAPTSPSNATVSITNDSKTISGFTPAAAVASQQDLVVAKQPGTNGESYTSLTFVHALSQIDVQAKCSDENVTIKVLGVKIVNIANTGTFTYPSNNIYDKSYIESSWSNTSGTVSYMSGVSSTESAVTLTSDAKSIMGTDDHFLMIPQTLTAGSVSGSSITGAYISVLCQVSVKQGSSTTATQIFPATSDKYAFAAVPLSGTTWKPGCKYTYTLNFCGDGSSYGGGCGVVDPAQTVPDGYTAPESSTDFDGAGTAGGNILGGAITFTVSVKEWDSTSDGTSVDTKM